MSEVFDIGSNVQEWFRINWTNVLEIFKVLSIFTTSQLLLLWCLQWLSRLQDGEAYNAVFKKLYTRRHGWLGYYRLCSHFVFFTHFWSDSIKDLINSSVLLRLFNLNHMKHIMLRRWHMIRSGVWLPDSGLILCKVKSTLVYIVIQYSCTY